MCVERPATVAVGGAAGERPARGAGVTASYKRALWTVAALNLGYGVVEIVGGLLARSQSLKADALDFLGDGLITLLGVLALGWRDRARARVTLAQGLFLGAMGVGVLVTTAYRIVVGASPVAEVMGVMGAVERDPVAGPPRGQGDRRALPAVGVAHCP